MVCLRNICINTLHKGDNDDNNNNIFSFLLCPESAVVHNITVGIKTCYVLDGPGIESLWGGET